MPEGDTIWRQARELSNALAGEELTICDLRVPAHATVDLRGRVVNAVRSRGKHILMDIDADIVLHTTLGMDGTWWIGAHGDKRRGSPAFQIRAVLATANRIAVGYRLPHVDVIRSSGEQHLLGHLGPDILGDDCDPANAIRRIKRAPNVEIADALLDQRNLAGIGNVYKSELCFIARVHPAELVANTNDDQLTRIVTEAHRLLVENKQRWKRVTTGDPRRPLWVYSRAGQPCRRCAAVIKSAQQGSGTTQRFTWWCPSCQGQHE